MTPIEILLIINFVAAVMNFVAPGSLTTSDGKVCYQVPVSESAAGSHKAASSSSYGSPMGAADYRLLPSEGKP